MHQHLCLKDIHHDIYVHCKTLYFLLILIKVCLQDRFEVSNKSITKLNNMELIILTNLIINFKMIEWSSRPSDLYFFCQYVTTVWEIDISTQLFVELRSAVDLASD